MGIPTSVYKKANGSWARTGSVKGDTGYNSYVVDSKNKKMDIYDAFGLMSFRNYNNEGFNFTDWTVTLKNDVDLVNMEWVAIGNETHPFKVTLDGSEFKADHLKITSTENFQGLFGVLDGGTVKNINFENVSLSGVSKSGCAVGEVINNGTVSYINVNSGTVTGVKTVDSCVGMIKAYGTVDHCTNNVNITGSVYNVGGIIGAAYYTETGHEMFVNNNTNKGKIIGGDPIGGIVGLSAANVKDNTNEASVTGGAGTCTGGIIGEQKSYGTVSGNTNKGIVDDSSDHGFGTGGIIGWIRYHGTGESSSYQMSSPIQVLDNINTAAIKGGNDGGGIVGTVYNNATLKRNSNSAPTINGVTFAAGIVGNYQITGTPADP